MWMLKCSWSRLVGTLLTLWLMQTPASADGIGFAQAEEGTWYCRGSDPVSALNCAREKCRREGQGQECYRVRWCFPAGWSGLMVVWVADYHGTDILCGAMSRTSVQAALKLMCEGNPQASRCEIFQLIDPRGQRHDAETGEFPGGAAR